MVDDYLYKEGFDDPMPYYNYIVHLLHDSRMVEDPEILYACDWFKLTKDYDLLKKLLENNPDIINKARKLISESL